MDRQGIIFDFNGTLFRDSELHSEAWRQMALKLRGTPLSNDELATNVHGRINPDIVRYLKGELLDIETITKLSLEKEEIYRNLCLEASPLRLAPGAEELLDFLAERNIPRAIATSSEQTNLAFYLRTFPLERWFTWEFIIFDDGTLPGKPAPDIYLKAAQRLSIAPEHCVVVEDAVSGIESARRAGIGTIVAVGPEENHKTLKGIPGVSQVVDSLDELKSLFLASPSTSAL